MTEPVSGISKASIFLQRVEAHNDNNMPYICFDLKPDIAMEGDRRGRVGDWRMEE
jgi:hypothetical protein